MTQGFKAKNYIGAISPYVAGKPIEETAQEYGLDVRSIVKLASNENPLGMPESAQKAVQAVLTGGNRYPDGNAHALRQALAQRLGVPEAWVIVGNGSDELLGLIARLVLEPGTNCVYSQYSFSVYELSAQENGAQCRQVPARDFGVDLPAMLQAVDSNTRLVFITNPNNPTGTVLTAQALSAFLEAVPRDCVVVIDEAYREFLPEQMRTDTLSWVRQYPNVLVTRTFSKAYGLAGLRAGYAVGQSALVEMMNRIRPPFNMNCLAQAAALGCLNDEAFLQRSYELNRRGVEQLESFFQARALRYIPSQANFILVKVGPQAGHINSGLLQQGVIVRPVTSYGLPDWLRISVGTPEQNERFMQAFDVACKDLGQDSPLHLTSESAHG